MLINTRPEQLRYTFYALVLTDPGVPIIMQLSLIREDAILRPLTSVNVKRVRLASTEEQIRGSPRRRTVYLSYSVVQDMFSRGDVHVMKQSAHLRVVYACFLAG